MDKFLFYIFFNIFFCRKFRLRHPTLDIFLGGSDTAPYFGNFKDSYIFEETPSEKVPGFVKIHVLDFLNRSWKLLWKFQYLIFYDDLDTVDQYFRVLFLSKDVVAIESVLGGCLKYDDFDKKMVLDECGYFNNFVNQAFVITEPDGKWIGHTSDVFFQGPKMVDGSECEDCVTGGFGISSLYFEPIINFNMNIVAPVYDEEDADIQDYLPVKTTIIQTSGNIGKDAAIPSAFERNRRLRESLANGAASETNDGSNGSKQRHNIMLPITNVPALNDKKTLMNFAKTGKIITSENQDSFGNDLDSADHKLDAVFDTLPTRGKEDVLILSGIYTGRKSIYAALKHPNDLPVVTAHGTRGFGHRWE